MVTINGGYLLCPSCKSVVLLRPLLKLQPLLAAEVAQWVRAFAPQAEGWVFESGVSGRPEVKTTV